MAWNDLIDVMDRAAAGAALAEHVYRDRDFRAQLQTTPEAALRRFELSAPTAPRRTSVRREGRTTWRISLEAGRARPIL